MKSARRGWIAALTVAIPAVLAACMFQDLKREIGLLNEVYAIVGKVHMETSDLSNVIVCLYTEIDGENRAVRYTLPEVTGHYSFVVGEGVFLVAAFADINQNFKHDPGEPAGAYGSPTPIRITRERFRDGPNRSVDNVDFGLIPRARFFATLPPSLTGADAERSLFRLGTVVALDDPMFDAENAGAGYWRPFSFLKQFGVGVYFLEPYDAEKIPVLFVHGNGTPRGWKPLVAGLNRERFQAWIYYYPTGLPLAGAASTLEGLIDALHHRYGFNNLVVTAHSMGGLVSRAAILKSRFDNRQPYIRLFISISTAWGGVRMARKGVEQAPVAVPSWHDVATGSVFIDNLFQRGLSPDVPFYLFFSHKGNCSVFMGNNDGTVELNSQLDYRAQQDAVRIFGYDEDHVSILASEPVIRQYNQLLATVID